MFVIIIMMFTLALTLVATPINWIPGIDYDVTRTSGTVDVGSVTIDIGPITGASIHTLPESYSLRNWALSVVSLVCTPST